MTSFDPASSDAQAPCANCVKAQAYAAKHYSKYTAADTECIYDDPEEMGDAGLRAKITRLESEICKQTWSASRICQALNVIRS